MAESWGHAPEAYWNGMLNTHDLPMSELMVIAAEWKASTTSNDGFSWDFDLDAYETALAEYKSAVNLTSDALAGEIWKRAEELATCDNGGFNAYICPHGCHMVPFEREYQEGDENFC